MAENKLIRIGVFYDGHYFLHVSNYYYFRHERRSRISLTGLHAFIREEVARLEETNLRYCQIVDAHYFRGRLLTSQAQKRGEQLVNERSFDDVLIREGITTHYLPLGPQGEKGIDVWFALEAFELAIHKRFDVTVLVASDSDYVPLVKKLNTLGSRVMVLGWDFKYLDDNGEPRETRTSQALLEEASYPIMMSSTIDDRTRKNDPQINNLFIKPRVDTGALVLDMDKPQRGTINNVLQGYGFISPEAGGENLFFYSADVINADIEELQKGDPVEYSLGTNQKGICAKDVRVVAK